MRKLLKYIVIILLLAAIVVAAMYFSGKNKQSYTAPLPNVHVSQPEKRTVAESISFGAHIEARAMIPVIPLVSGTITKYPARAGDYIKEGDLLAQIDPAPFQQQMLQAKAAYTGYESSFNRIAGLYRAGAATRQDYETMQSQRDASHAQYELAQLQLSYAKVTAPVSGTILAAPLAVGNIGSQQQPVAIIADLDELVIRLQVPEKYFSLFVKNRNNLSAVVIRESENSSTGTIQEKCNARVDTLAPYVDARSKTFEAVFKLADAPETFRPGMYTRIAVTFSEHKNVPALPITSRKTDGSCYIFSAENGESSEKIKSMLAEDENVSGLATHVSFNDVISDGEWFVVPNEYADKLFIIEGQGSVFNGQQVIATALSKNGSSL